MPVIRCSLSVGRRVHFVSFLRQSYIPKTSSSSPVSAINWLDLREVSVLSSREWKQTTIVHTYFYVCRSYNSRVPPVGALAFTYVKLPHCKRHDVAKQTLFHAPPVLQSLERIMTLSCLQHFVLKYSRVRSKKVVNIWLLTIYYEWQDSRSNALMNIEIGNTNVVYLLADQRIFSFYTACMYLLLLL